MENTPAITVILIGTAGVLFIVFAICIKAIFKANSKKPTRAERIKRARATAAFHNTLFHPDRN